MKLYLLFYDKDTGAREEWNTFYTPVEVFTTPHKRADREQQVKDAGFDTFTEDVDADPSGLVEHPSIVQADDEGNEMGKFKVWIDGNAQKNTVETDFDIIEAANMNEALDKAAQMAGYIDHADIAQELGWEDSEFNIVEVA